MKASDFINLFKTGKLGKKRQHAGYKVMDGEHCQLLVRSTRKWGAPGGSELIGIYFSNDICIFHNNFNKLRGSVTNQVDEPKPVITHNILNQNDTTLIDSGIIGFDDVKGLMVVEIGETPWLFEHDPSYSPSRYSNFSWKYNTGTQVSRRVGMVAGAVADVELPEGVISTIGYMLKVMPSDFQPVATSEADMKLLMNPPNPFNYGLGVDDLVVQSVYGRNGHGCVPLYMKLKVGKTSRGTQFKADAKAFNDATQRFEHREPAYWENLTSDDNGTVLVGAGDEVYLKGHVYNRYASNDLADFKVWHKVLGKTARIRLPVR